MKLEEFAKLAGVEIVVCDAIWGGKVGYQTRGHTNTTICGFKTKKEAYRNWLDDEFDEHMIILYKNVLRS